LRSALPPLSASSQAAPLWLGSALYRARPLVVVIESLDTLVMRAGGGRAVVGRPAELTCLYRLLDHRYLLGWPAGGLLVATSETPVCAYVRGGGEGGARGSSQQVRKYIRRPAEVSLSTVSTGGMRWYTNR